MTPGPRNTPYEIKIGYIGGGSKYWAQELMADLALCGKLKGELVLYDIDFAAAKRNEAIGQKIYAQEAATGKFAVRATEDLAECLTGADFVVFSIEPGPTECRYADLIIPERYGIMQPVGDTVGPGGIVRALRAIPIKMHYGEAIAEYCPQAWVINYTNPMTLCTAALYEAAPEIKAFGCCHEVFGTQNRLAGLVAQWFGVEKPARHDIKLEVSGVNHFTHVSSATWEGHDLFPKLMEHIAEEGYFRSRQSEAEKRVAEGNHFGSEGLVAMDFLRRFGALGAAGDRHLVEFVPWYARDEATLHRWGVVRTPYQWRLERSKGDGPAVDSFDQKKLNPSGEEGVTQMLALLGGERLVTNVNIPNRGQMMQAPEDHVVETYALFERDSLRPLVAEPLPPGTASLVETTIRVQELTLAASLERSPDLALEAILADPLVNLSTDDAWEMLQAMLMHVKDYLPGW